MDTLAQVSGIILIVDDNPTNLSVLSKALKTAGFRTRVAVDGESAIATATEDPPDLILLDVQMPGIDGFETCTRLKTIPSVKEVPVIFITASADVENKVKGLSLGAVDYVTKPFQHEEVLARVKVHLMLRLLAKKVQEQAEALQKANEELNRLANLDGLTEVANRRRFDDYLACEWYRSARERQPLSLILCDIDYFKYYNDYYGHQVGDTCLKQVAQTIQASLKRPADLLARYGGEEFAIVLPNTPPEGAICVAETIRSNIHQLKIPHDRSLVDPCITLSLGVAFQIPNTHSQPKLLIAAADRALYSAKAKGRNNAYALSASESAQYALDNTQSIA
jgi:diguanylate cyclase (GGDEF)-like protein